MKKNINIIILIFIVIVALGWIAIKYNPFNSGKRFVYSNSDVITRIEIKEDTTTTTLEKIDGKWMVNGEYEANSTTVDNLQVITEKIEVQYPLPKIYENVYTDSLLVTKGIRLQLYSNNSLKRDYYLYTADSVGCIGLITGKHQPYCVYIPGMNINIFDYLSASSGFWLNNIAFSFNPKDIVSVTVENMLQPEQSFKIMHADTGSYQLIDSYNLSKIEQLNKSVIDRYLTYFNAVTFDSRPNLSQSQQEEILLSDYPYTLAIETKKGKFNYKVIYIPVNDKFDAYGHALEYDRKHFYLVMNDNKDIVIASWLTFDILLKNLSDFVNK